MMDKQTFNKSCIDFSKNPVIGNVTWKDTTSYLEGDTEKIPNHFTVIISGVKIWISTDYVGNTEFHWKLYCPSFNIESEFQIPSTAKNAAEMSIIFMKQFVELTNNAFSRLNPF